MTVEPDFRTMPDDQVARAGSRMIRDTVEADDAARKATMLASLEGKSANDMTPEELAYFERTLGLKPSAPWRGYGRPV